MAGALFLAEHDNNLCKKDQERLVFAMNSTKARLNIWLAGVIIDHS
ncbi:hypothetical protein [Legionella hackeliae]|nr:hypothetical protein [Legionella hackeliae]